MSQNTLTRMTGCPIAHNKNSLTAGPHGPILLQDVDLLEKLTQFNREQIPPRNVHALGTGAYGKLTITHDITKYSAAKLFSKIGKETQLFVRMSGTFTERGDADTTRDIRGFAIKFYTEEGNWDLLSINLPVFGLRDAKVGPDSVHSLKRDPRTSMWNPTQTWDYVATHPEGLHFAIMMYTDRIGTPLTFRHMHGYGCNTFSFVNSEKKRFWCKFHLISELGAKGMSQEEAKLIAGEDPNWLTRDLHRAIENGNYPKWRFCCQVMPEEDGYKYPFTFDCTKVWKHSDYPLIDIGILELNKNVVDHFSEVEQVAFSPATVVPGIGFSPDKLLQGRLLIYDDAQHHRLGPHFKQYPTNMPKCPVRNYAVGGMGNSIVKNNFPHYQGSMFGGPVVDPTYLEPYFKVDGPAGFYDPPGEGTEIDLYEQPRALLTVLSEQEKSNLIENLAASWAKIPDKIVEMLLPNFYKLDQKFGEKLEERWKVRKSTAVSPGEKVVVRLTQTLIQPTQEKPKNVS